MSPAWQTKREGWIKECEAVKTNVQAAKLLMEFETNVSWNAVKENWQTRRDAWLKDCSVIK